MQNKAFTLVTDPGHGWLVVTHDELHTVGLNATMLSTYSYWDADYFYLEEDMDYGIFAAAFKRTFGEAPSITLFNRKTRSPIRRKNPNRKGETDFSKLCALM